MRDMSEGGKGGGEVTTTRSVKVARRLKRKKKREAAKMLRGALRADEAQPCSDAAVASDDEYDAGYEARLA